MKTTLVLMTALASLGTIPGRAAQNPERALIAYMEVKPGTEREFLRAAQNVIEASRKEAGNLRYQLHRSATNPRQFIFYEFFRSHADLKFHRYSPHVLEFLRVTKPYTLKFTLEEYVPQGEIQ